MKKNKLYIKNFKQIIQLLFIAFVISACGGGGGGGSSTSNVVDKPITLTGSPITSINEDELYEFQVFAENGSGSLIYSIVNAPDWITISSAGVVSGTPLTDADTGSFSDIIISVTDANQKSASLSAFDLQVTPINDAPVITFDIDSLNLEARQRFTINYSVTDEEGDDFTTSIQGMDDALTLNVFDQTIEGLAKDIDSVAQGTLSIDIVSSGISKITNLAVTVYPMTASGLGKTLIGSKTGKGIHLVILGDGYQEIELVQYQQDALNFVDIMTSDQGIAKHMSGWNVHIVKTPSIDSGSDTVFGEDTINTYFNSGYNCLNIERLLCADSEVVNAILLDEYPNHHQAIVIVNDPRYGGSGSQFSVYSRSAPEIALHEMGHSFAHLADEYLDDNLAAVNASIYQEGEYANVSTITDPNAVVWAHWIDDKSNYPTADGEEGIGIFEGALYNSIGFYRPESNSRMLSNEADFGVVSSEQWIIEMYTQAGAINSLSPITQEVVTNQGSSITFNVEPIFDTSLQRVEWYIDGVIDNAFTNTTTMTLDKTIGSYLISVRVLDISGSVRKSNPFADYIYSWQMTVN